MHLLIASFHTHATGRGMRRWNTFSWLVCICLLGAKTCKSKSALQSIKTDTLPSNPTSTTVATSSKRTTKGQALDVTPPGSSTKEGTTAAVRTAPPASQAIQSRGSAIGSKQSNTSSATSEKPPIFSFKEQGIAIQAGEQKQLTLQASGNTNGYVFKSLSIKKESRTTPYQNQFGLKDCIENRLPCSFPASGFSLNLNPIATLAAGTYTLTIRVGKQGVKSKPTNECISCEIVLIKKEALKNEEPVAGNMTSNQTANHLTQETRKQGVVPKEEPVAKETGTNTQNNLAQGNRAKGGALVVPKKEAGTSIQETSAQNQSEKAPITFSKIQNLETVPLTCKVGEEKTVDYEIDNPEQYVILNVQMIKVNNTRSSPKRGFHIDGYKRGSVFGNTITFYAKSKGAYTLCLELKNKDNPKELKKFSCSISILE